jgi:hypothetical protein
MLTYCCIYVKMNNIADNFAKACDLYQPYWRVVRLAASQESWRGFSTTELVGVLAYNLPTLIEAVTWALDDESQPPARVVEQAWRLLKKPGGELFAEVGRRSADLAMAFLPIVARLDAIGVELLGRVAPAGRALIGDPREGSSLSVLLEALKVDYLSDYESSDSRDLRQIAMEGAIKKYHSQQREVFQLLSGMPRQFDKRQLVMTALVLGPGRDSAPGEFDSARGEIEGPLARAELKGPRWHRWPSFRGFLVKDLIASLLPLQNPNSLPSAAHDAWRQELEKRGAKTRGGGGGRHAKKSGTVHDRAEHVSFEELRNSDRFSVVNDQSWSQHEAARAMRFAAKRWGARGHSFLKALMKGATVEEASETAGVSRQMGHKYLKKLREELKAE